MRRKLARVTRVGGALAALALVFGGAGCAGTKSASESSSKPKVALVTINSQAVFFKQLAQGAKRAAQQQGVDLTIFNANNDPDAQNSAIENYAQQGFDAVIVEAIDVKGIRPALHTAKKAGLNVIAVDAIVQDKAVDVQVGIDNTKAGQLIGDFFNRWAKDQHRRGVSIGEISALNSFIQIQRQKGFEREVKADGNEIAQVVDGKNVQEDALQAAEDLLTSQRGRIGAVYATGEPALLGAVAAAKSQHQTDSLRVFGWDLTGEAISGIDRGFVVGVVQQDPYTEGVRAIGAAKQLADGKQPPKTINVPVTIVTKKNVDKYRSTFGKA